MDARPTKDILYMNWAGNGVFYGETYFPSLAIGGTELEGKWIKRIYIELEELEEPEGNFY